MILLGYHKAARDRADTALDDAGVLVEDEGIDAG